jgi:hypothetical protein
MARPKRPPHPMLAVAREHLLKLAPDLADLPLRLQQLDGPPGAPRYAVSVAACHRESDCPHGVVNESACSVPTCALRHSFRLLLTRDGEVVQTIEGDRQWERHHIQGDQF